MIADASSQTPAGVMPQSAKTRAMTKHEASRTLLKSPPELWAECSDAASLSRHLDQFGEIKITRLEPETAVAWEGNAISGTVRLEPSGWGTRVILTAEEAEVPDLPPPVKPVQAAEPSNGTEGAVEPEPSAATESDPEPQPPETEADAAGEESSVGVAFAEPEAAAATPASLAARKGLVARFFARMRGDVAAPEPARPAARQRPGSEPTPEPDASIEPQRAAEPTADTPPAAEPDLVTEPEHGSPAEAAVAPAVTETALKDALESLGTAHHRPFSRG
jgi:hypothetical protein